MRTHHNGVNQEVAKRKILEFVRVGEKVILGIRTRKKKEKVVKKKRLKYLSEEEAGLSTVRGWNSTAS